MSTRHQEALAHLLYGVQEGGGFVQLTGEVGTGKTTLTRALLEQVPGNVDVALVLNPKMTAQEFVATICDELKVAYSRDHSSVKALVDALNGYLLSAHANSHRVVLIVDEAQNFQPEVLEQIRLLTNLETTQQKLLQIILVGQPELRELLARKELRQLAQRITARYHLVPMTYEETKGYIRHRLKVAGATRSIFTVSAIRQLWRYSGGVPRLVNILADRTLLGAYSAEVSRVTAPMVKRAHKELNAIDADPHRSWLSLWFAAVAILIMVGGAFVGYQLSVSRPTIALNDRSNGVVAELPSSINAATQEAQVFQKNETTPLPTVDSNVQMQANIDNKKMVLNGAEFKRYLVEEPQSLELNTAFSIIFSFWGVDYNSLIGATGCEKALAVRKRCYWGNTSWGDFVRLNRPALVWISNPSNTDLKHYFIVKSIEGDNVSLLVGQRQVIVSHDELQDIWPKKHLVLWQPPSMDFDLIRPGDKGNLVLWLRRGIDKVLGLESVSLQADVYDDSLIERVKMFQKQNGLVADGLVGDVTMLYLNAVLDGEGIPLLVKSN